MDIGKQQQFSSLQCHTVYGCVQLPQPLDHNDAKQCRAAVMSATTTSIVVCKHPTQLSKVIASPGTIRAPLSSDSSLNHYFSLLTMVEKLRTKRDFLFEPVDNRHDRCWSRDPCDLIAASTAIVVLHKPKRLPMISSSNSVRCEQQARKQDWQRRRAPQTLTKMGASQLQNTRHDDSGLA